MVSYSHWDFHRHAELAGFSPLDTPFSPKAALVLLLRGRAEDSWCCVESGSSSAVGSLVVNQRKRPMPASTLECPNLVDLISNTALAFLETNMQRRGLSKINCNHAA